jgi:hypothetical protein
LTELPVPSAVNRPPLGAFYAKNAFDKLFRLVKSLTPAEKRYFKIFVQNKAERESKYSRLFDLVDAAAEFDDEKLKTKIYKSQPADGKKYPELKSYLYDLVLRSLQSFDEQHTVESRLNHLLQGVAALFKRGLYDDCRELLQKRPKSPGNTRCSGNSWRLSAGKNSWPTRAWTWIFCRRNWSG